MFRMHYMSFFLGPLDLALVIAYLTHNEAGRLTGETPIKRYESSSMLHKRFLQLKGEDYLAAPTSRQHAQYLEDIQNGDTDPGELKIYAAVKLNNWNVEATTVDKDCKVFLTFTYEVEDTMKTVHLDGCIV
ncbi:hypothetical protein DVH05_009006 [Phytophthora capsici]|nr:hypothetical protein DVH05_009006 [Phytophthora capsici]